MKQIISIILLTGALLTGCSKSDDSTMLSIGTESFTWDSDVRLQKVQVKCDGKWTAKSDVYWCAPIRKNGEGNAGLPIWVSPNLTGEARQGTITITAAGATKTISVSQPAFTGSLDDYEYHLPVVFHILYKDKNDESQYVKEGQMAKILTEVNKLYAQNNMNIVFELAQYDDNGEELKEPGVVRHEVTFDEYDPELFLSSKHEDNRQYAKYAQNMKKYINVYVFRFAQDDEKNSTMGISNMAIVPMAHPLDSLVATDAANDYAYTATPWGCCINNEYIYEWQEGNSLNPQYIAATVAHELGHYLGLLHTFSSDECNIDDACDDTNICDYENYVSYIAAYIKQQQDAGVSSFKMSDLARRKDCKTLKEYVAHNILDYSFCYNDEFTEQQRKRTRHVLWYGPLVPGPKLVQYNTTGITTRGGKEKPDITGRIQPCPGIIKTKPFSTSYQ